MPWFSVSVFGRWIPAGACPAQDGSPPPVFGLHHTAQAKRLDSQVDDVPVRSAGKTVVVVVCYQQAGVVVVVEGAERHSTAVDRNAIQLCTSLALTAVLRFQTGSYNSLHFLMRGASFSPLCISYGENRKKQADGMTAPFQKT